MRRTIVAAAFAATALPLAGLPAIAQGIAPQPNAIVSPIPPARAVTLHGTIASINTQTRAVLIQSASGQFVTVTAPPEINLAALKVGQAVNAQYVRAVAFVVGQPGTTPPENEIAAEIERQKGGPGFDAADIKRISAVIVGIDVPAHSIDVVNPNGGGVVTVVVTQPDRIAMLPQLQVGDTITAVVGTSRAVAITPASASFMVPIGAGQTGDTGR
jgi:hypothetical protein